MVSHHHGTFLVDGCFLPSDIVVDIFWQLPLLKFLAFKDDTNLVYRYCKFLSSVHRSIFIAEDKNCFRLRMENVFLEFIKRLESLRLLDDDHLPWCRHRILHGQVCYLCSINISTKDHSEIKSLLLGRENLVLEKTAELVDIIGLITHE